MDDEVRFIGLVFDDARVRPSPHDVRRLVSVMEDRGFSVSEQLPSGRPETSTEGDRAEDDRGTTLQVWHQDFFAARVVLETDWMVQIVTDVRDIHVVGDPELSRRGIDLLVRLVGAVTEVADTYLGFLSNEEDDDLSFVVEDPPVEITEPLALVYLGSRYLDDWPEAPAFAADAELDVALPAGRLIVPSLADLVP